MPLTRGQMDEVKSLGGMLATKTATFTGAAGAGAIGTVAIFTVTGVVQMRLIARCTTGLAGVTATISVGTALTPVGILVSTVATTLAASELWVDATVDASVKLATTAAENIVNQSVIATVGTAAITAGAIEFTCIWKPLSDNATVVAA